MMVVSFTNHPEAVTNTGYATSLSTKAVTLLISFSAFSYMILVLMKYSIF